MLVVTIDFGPKVVWTLGLLLVLWLGYVLWRVSAELRERKINIDTAKRIAWQVRSPHIAEAPAEPVRRVPRESGIIARRWTGERAA